MHNIPKDIQLLAEKFLQGTISPDEQQVLNAWYEQRLPADIEWPSETDTEEILRERMLGVIRNNRADTGAAVLPMRRRHLWRWAAASLVILAAGLAAYLAQPTGLKQQPVSVKARPVTPDIQPGGNKAVLTLADGSEIVLDQSANGTLARQGNTLVTKLKDGRIAYRSPVTGASATPGINTLRTPKGGQYALQLPDGSLVWLNAASSLVFPAAFTSRERVVQLTGEAYFEIVSDKQKPFRVQLADKSVVEVLGTHFNVMAYQEEKSIQATLVEGSVRVSHDMQSQVIKPGEQAVIKAGIQVAAVNVDDAIAWHKGDFQFSNADLDVILRQLERWYGVEFRYDQLPAKKLNGSISRNYSLSQVLKMLELTSHISFERENNIVRVIN